MTKNERKPETSRYVHADIRLLSSRRRETRKYGLHDMSIEYDIKNIEVCILFTIQLMMANLSFELFV